MARPTTGSDLDNNVKAFVDGGYDKLTNVLFNRTYWAVSLGVMAIGLILSCIPTPPTIILGALLMVLPIAAYGIAWGVVGVTDLTNRICSAIVNKFNEWKENRTASDNENCFTKLKGKAASCFKGNDEENGNSSSCWGRRNQYSSLYDNDAVVHAVDYDQEHEEDNSHGQ